MNPYICTRSCNCITVLHNEQGTIANVIIHESFNLFIITHILYDIFNNEIRNYFIHCVYEHEYTLVHIIIYV